VIVTLVRFVLLLLLFNFVMHCIISTVVVAFEIKGDDASQWRNPNFNPPTTLKPHKRHASSPLQHSRTTVRVCDNANLMTSVMRPDPKYELAWVPQVPHSETEQPETSAVGVTILITFALEMMMLTAGIFYIPGCEWSQVQIDYVGRCWYA